MAGLFYAYAPDYIWSYYYNMLNLVNLSIMAVENNVPAINAAMEKGSVDSETIKLQGYYYGQLLALRGWAYAGLLNYFCDPMDMLESTMDQELSIPIYTEVEVKSGAMGAPRATVSEVYDRIYEDLSMAIDLLDFYGTLNNRGSKLEIDADVARVILAYAMLNHGNKDGVEIVKGKTAYDIALEQAMAAINGGKYPIMKYADLTTTGFSDLSASNWMWAENVTVENTTALASFFGQVDIHTYSYAAAGDTKTIDSNLYDEIAANAWDGRVNWFNSGDVKFPYCPEGKFYSPAYKDITDLDKVDRNWLCDNIFMRIEVAYLIAAEAAYKKGDEATAVSYLKQLCDERVIPGKETEYNTWLGTLTGAALEKAIIYNWRVEMWGEGYGLQTLRRLSKTVKLGKNHKHRAETAIDISLDYVQFQCEIPSTETRYNPYLNNRNLTHSNK